MNDTREALQALQRILHLRTLRDLHARMDLPVSIATLSRILAGKPVSRSAENAVRVALGLEPVYGRQRIRRKMTKEQAAIWDRMTPAQRDKAIGLYGGEW